MYSLYTITYLISPLCLVRNIGPCALCLASPQEIPYVRSSLSRLLFQVVDGRHRLRFPWVFQSSACLVMLVGSRRRVCPTIAISAP